MKSVAEIVADAGGVDKFLEGAKLKPAAARREKQLRQLKALGVNVQFPTRWQRKVGPLLIWPSIGTWANEATGQCGRLYNISMRELIESQVPKEMR